MSKNDAEQCYLHSRASFIRCSGRSFGIVRSETQAMELFFFLIPITFLSYNLVKICVHELSFSNYYTKLR
jgi:hypothetical protein